MVAAAAATPLIVKLAPAIIGAAGSLAGGLASGSGGSSGGWRSTLAAQTAHQFQADMATHGIRWRVHDAKAAGLHPLASLGASTMSYSPSHVGGSRGRDYSWMADAGQNIGRAIAAGLDKDQKRLMAAQIRSAEADATNKEIENQIKAKEALDILYGRGGLPAPDHPSGAYGPSVPGQDDGLMRGGNIKAKVLGEDRYFGSGIDPYPEPLEKYYHDKDGFYKAMPTQGASEPLESAEAHKWIYGGLTLRDMYDARNWYKRPHSEGAIVHRKEVIEQRKSLPKLNPGWEWRFSSGRGFKPAKIGKGVYGSRFYVEGNIGIHNNGKWYGKYWREPKR